MLYIYNILNVIFSMLYIDKHIWIYITHIYIYNKCIYSFHYGLL